MADIASTLESEAAKAQSMSNDGVSVTRRSLSELIAYDKYLRDQAATTSVANAFKKMTLKIVPPGGH